MIVISNVCLHKPDKNKAIYLKQYYLFVSHKYNLYLDRHTVMMRLLLTCVAIKSKVGPKHT